MPQAIGRDNNFAIDDLADLQRHVGRAAFLNPNDSGRSLLHVRFHENRVGGWEQVHCATPGSLRVLDCESGAQVTQWPLQDRTAAAATGLDATVETLVPLELPGVLVRLGIANRSHCVRRLDVVATPPVGVANHSSGVRWYVVSSPSSGPMFSREAHGIGACGGEFRVSPGAVRDLLFFFAGEAGRQGVTIDDGLFEEEGLRVRQSSEDRFPGHKPIRVETPDEAFDRMVNRELPWLAVVLENWGWPNTIFINGMRGSGLQISEDSLPSEVLNAILSEKLGIEQTVFGWQLVPTLPEDWPGFDAWLGPSFGGIHYKVICVRGGSRTETQGEGILVLGNGKVTVADVPVADASALRLVVAKLSSAE